MSVANLRSDVLTNDLKQSEAMNLLAGAYRSLSKADQEVVALYAASGGKRGWTEASSGGQTPNNLRVRLHRATKRLRTRLESDSNSLHKVSPKMLEALLQPSSLAQAMAIGTVARKTGTLESNDDRYIRVTIELREDEFSVEARNALFEFFAFDRISISRAGEASYVESHFG